MDSSIDSGDNPTDFVGENVRNREDIEEVERLFDTYHALLVH